MSTYLDFLESLLGDCVCKCDKIIHDLHYSESQSKISNQDWKHRQRYFQRAHAITQRHMMRTRRDLRIKQK